MSANEHRGPKVFFRNNTGISKEEQSVHIFFFYHERSVSR